MRVKQVICLALAISSILIPAMGQSASHAKPAFQKLQGLAGNWQGKDNDGKIEDKDHPDKH